MLASGNWPANPVTQADLHGPWAHTDLTVLYTALLSDTALLIPELNQLEKLQEMLLTGKKEENWFDL